MLRTPNGRQLRWLIAGAISVAAATACGQNGGSSSAPAVPAATFPDAESAAAKVFVKKCGECHAPPAPTAHTAVTWPSVMHRMQQRRIAKGKGALTDPEFDIILDYLTTHARP